MTNPEIKEWLEWFLSVTDKASTFKGKLGLYYQYHGVEVRDFAYQPIGRDIHLDSELQLVLQEEITIQGWTFELETYEFLTPSCTIRCCAKHARPVVKTFSFEADTILEAFMRVFRKAWEATR